MYRSTWSVCHIAHSEYSPDWYLLSPFSIACRFSACMIHFKNDPYRLPASACRICTGIAVQSLTTCFTVRNFYSHYHTVITFSFSVTAFFPHFFWFKFLQTLHSLHYALQSSNQAFSAKVSRIESIEFFFPPFPSLRVLAQSIILGTNRSIKP